MTAALGLSLVPESRAAGPLVERCVAYESEDCAGKAPGAQCGGGTTQNLLWNVCIAEDRLMLSGDPANLIRYHCHCGSSRPGSVCIQNREFNDFETQLKIWQLIDQLNADLWADRENAQKEVLGMCSCTYGVELTELLHSLENDARLPPETRRRIADLVVQCQRLARLSWEQQMQP